VRLAGDDGRHIERFVETVRSKTTEPVERIVRAVVYGLLAAVLGVVALVLLAIAAVASSTPTSPERSGRPTSSSARSSPPPGCSCGPAAGRRPTDADAGAEGRRNLRPRHRVLLPVAPRQVRKDQLCPSPATW
jgi:hypothetical protein